jgi:hypothetical protein
VVRRNIEKMRSSFMVTLVIASMVTARASRCFREGSMKLDVLRLVRECLEYNFRVEERVYGNRADCVIDEAVQEKWGLNGQKPELTPEEEGAR